MILVTTNILKRIFNSLIFVMFHLFGEKILQKIQPQQQYVCKLFNSNVFNCFSFIHYRKFPTILVLILILSALLMMPFQSLSSVHFVVSASTSTRFPFPMNIEEDYSSQFLKRRLSPINHVIKIKYGLLRGLLVDFDQMTSSSVTNNSETNDLPPKLPPIKSYLGVPYASPPTGALRFMPPVTPAHWRGIRNADQLSPLCPQRFPFSSTILNQSTEALKHMPLLKYEWLKRTIPRMMNQSEDCLYLNIYSPYLGPEWSDLGQKSQQTKNTVTNTVNDHNNEEADAAENQDWLDRHFHSYRYGTATTANIRTTHNIRLKRHLETESVSSSSSSKSWTKIILKNSNQNTTFDYNHNHYQSSMLQTHPNQFTGEKNEENFRMIDHHHHDDWNDFNLVTMATTKVHTVPKFRRHLSSPSISSSEPSAKSSKRKIRGVFGGSSSGGGSGDKSSRSQSVTNMDSSSETETTIGFPVLVFLTGESYEWNPGSLFDGSILASFGQVVVVTLNFRLGILGFMPANIDGTLRGNYGLMDQVAALHWIQENIAQFGGSPTNITLVGHGYGASCAHLLMLSPMAKGLFNRVILMGGSALSPWAIARDASHYAEKVGHQVDCPTPDSPTIIDCLRIRSVHQLQSVQYQVPDHLAGFGPIIDGIVVPQEPRILLHQIRQNLWKSQQQASSKSGDDYLNQYASPTPATPPSWSTLSAHLHRINTGSNLNTGSDFTSTSYVIKRQTSTLSLPNPDLMVGVTSAEVPAFIFNSHEEQNGISVARRNRLLRTLVRNLYDYHQQAIFYTLVNEYTDWTLPTEQPLNLMDSLAELYGDALVIAPLVESLDHHYAQSIITSYTKSSVSGSSKSSSIPNSYFYVFTYQNDNLSKYRFNERLGATHGDDLAFIFGVPFLTSRQKFYKTLNRDQQQYHGERNHHNYLYPTFDISPNWYPFLTTFDSIPGASIQNHSTEMKLCQKFIEAWINFAKQGDPNLIPTTTSTIKQPSSLVNKLHSSRHHQHKRQQQQLDEDQWMPSTSTSTSWWTHDRWLQRYGYQTVSTWDSQTTTNNNDNNNIDDSKTKTTTFWPSYDTIQRPYLQFGSSIELHNHYHSHRLSVWLSLIPRLHVPIELKDLTSSSNVLSIKNNINNNDNDNNSNDDSNGDNNNQEINLESEQNFYLKHHLLPDHENLDTYDGIIKPLSLKIPESKQWRQQHLRRNITSLYEQHQQILYGRLYQTNPEMDSDLETEEISPKLTSSLSHHLFRQVNDTTMTGNNIINNDNNRNNENSVQEARRIDQQQQQQRSKSSKSGISNKNTVSDNKFNNKNNNNNNSNQYSSGKHLNNKNITIRKNSSISSNTSSTHYEAQMTPETYSTLVLLSFVIGGTLFILNLIIVVGVYFQMKNNGDGGFNKCDQQSASHNTNKNNNDDDNEHGTLPSTSLMEANNSNKNSPNKSIKDDDNDSEWCSTTPSPLYKNKINDNNRLAISANEQCNHHHQHQQQQQRKHHRNHHQNIIRYQNQVYQNPHSSQSTSTTTTRMPNNNKFSNNNKNKEKVISDQSNVSSSPFKRNHQNRQRGGTMELITVDVTGYHHQQHNDSIQNLDSVLHLNQIDGGTSLPTLGSSSEQSTPLKSILKNSLKKDTTTKTTNMMTMINDETSYDANIINETAAYHLISSSINNNNNSYTTMVHPLQQYNTITSMDNALISTHYSENSSGHHHHPSSLQLIYRPLDPDDNNNGISSVANQHQQQQQPEEQSLVQTNTMNTATAAAYLDGNNFVSFISADASRDLSQLPYITLTEMYQQNQQQQINQEKESNQSGNSNFSVS